MRMSRKNWLIALLIITLTSAAGYTVYWLLHSDPQRNVTTPDDLSTQFTTARVVGRFKGERQWSIEAQAMQDYGDHMLMTNITNGIIYNENKEALNFKAGQATWQKTRDGRECNDLSLRGGVQIFRGGQMVLETAALDWNALQSQLSAPEKVSFKYEGSSAEAGQFVYNAATETVTLTNDVNLHLEDGSIVIVDGQVSYNLQTGEFSATGPSHLAPAPVTPPS